MFLAAVRQRHTHRVNEDKVSGLKKEKNAWLHCHPEPNEGILTVGVIEGRREDDEILAAFQQRPYPANAGWVEWAAVSSLLPFLAHCHNSYYARERREESERQEGSSVNNRRFNEESAPSDTQNVISVNPLNSSKSLMQEFFMASLSQKQVNFFRRHVWTFADCPKCITKTNGDVLRRSKDL